MKRLLILSAALLTVSAAALVGTRDAWSAPEGAAYAGDTVHSYVIFKVKHLNASWSYGRFNEFTVSFDTNDAGTELTSAAFVVKAASVDTGNAKRDQHLQGPDFFNAKQFADISFKSTAVKSAGAGAWEVTGDLSLHGVTKAVTVNVAKVGDGKGPKGEVLLGLETTFAVKRSEFGMTYGVGPVSDEVTLTVAVEGARK